MKKSLSHLPKHKQDELKLIRDTMQRSRPGNYRIRGIQERIMYD